MKSLRKAIDAKCKECICDPIGGATSNYLRGEDMTRGVSETLPTRHAARYRRGILWTTDKRCKVTREVTADLFELSQDLGGWDSLSVQQRILCERVVFIRRRVLEYESASMADKPLPFEAGVYSNLANVLVGYLRTLGLERKARHVRSLREHLESAAKAVNA